ncbi:MAG: hypothetical protein ACQESK_07085 [Bacteroidota bacterium]
MKNYQLIENKLEKFIRKFYVNALLKGGILFLSFGLLYFLLVVGLEYFFWLTSLGRSILFWTFVLVELFLFVKFIVVPLSKIFKISKGIDYHKASEIIGKHFPKVNDKLTNILQLKKSGADSDLIIAGIEQKSAELKPIPFQIAISFKQNLKYTKYLAIPLLIFLVIFMSGKTDLFSESYKRVVDYQTVYEPPAPFQFVVLNENLQVEEGKGFQLQVFTEGDVQPENPQIEFNNQSYYLKKNEAGHFQYDFDGLTNNIDFKLSANGFSSRNYEIEVVEVPKILNFEMQLDYPAYTQLENETKFGSGNAEIPEGTTISWKIATASTDLINLKFPDTVFSLQKDKDEFFLEEQIYSSLQYRLSTSNKNRTDYENLSYRLDVVKDEYPKISLQQKKDSLDQDISYYKGNLSDDYGLTKLKLVYHPIDDIQQKKELTIPVAKATYDEFVYTFPNKKLELKEGVSYRYYFKVFDNDGVNGSKSTQSDYFNYRKKTAKEQKQENLEQQGKSIKGMQQSFDEIKDSKQSSEDLEQLQKEKKKLNFSDKKKIENFIERQKQQREMMKKFSKQLKDDLKEYNPNEQNKQKEDLQNRLEENEKRLEENEEMLEELEKYKDKIDKNEFKDKLDEFKNESEKQERNLEQLLELTKRFYVEEKANQVAENLKDLAEEQQELSEDEESNSKENQEEINDAFEELKDDLEELMEENDKLQKPMDLFRDEEGEESIQQDLQDALEQLSNESDSDGEESDSSSEEQNESENADDSLESDSEDSDNGESDENQPQDSPPSSPQESQQNAAQKMKEMSEKMGMSMMSGSQEQQSEDIETLRQIIANLIIFSFQQEDLLKEFKYISNSNPVFAQKLRQQSHLRENFSHIDDSLYSLALRNPMISEQITSKLSDIQFNIDKSLERLADNKLETAVSNQQYAMTFANDLALMLDGALDNMQDQLSGGSGQGKSGEGQGGDSPGDQLSDIIKSHDELNEEMKNQSGKSPGGEKEGSSGKDGEQSGKGEGGDSQDGQQPSSKDGDQSQPNDDGNQQGDQMSGEIYEIYKKQQELRNQLEDRIEQLGLDSDSRNLRKSLDQLEEELLMNGFSSDALKNMENIKHQLLKLKEAANRQGQDDKRQAETNTEEFNPSSAPEIDRAKEYFNTTEILNRQNLPLQPKFKRLIKKYFDESTD